MYIIKYIKKNPFDVIVLVINNIEDIITVFFFALLTYKYFCPKFSYIDSLYEYNN